MSLTDEDRERIEAEERERARVRLLLEQGPVIVRFARGCRSGCGCLLSLFSFAIVLGIALAVVFLFTGGGDSAGEAACGRFYEFSEIVGGTTFSQFDLGSRLDDIQELAAEADAEIRVAGDGLFAAAQSGDTGRIIAAGANMGAACAKAGHSP